MTDLIIRIKKHPDGTAALTCVRSDGSVTWQRLRGRPGLFFPHHDLTHYAVETTLGHRDAFYGLVAAGWDLGDFGASSPRGPLPSEAARVELLVGFLDVERAGGDRWSALEFNEHLSRFLRSRGTEEPIQVTEEDLDRIREVRGDLFARWAAVPPGEALELEFDLPPPR